MGYGIEMLVDVFSKKMFFHTMPPKQIYSHIRDIYIMISKGFCFDQCWLGMHFQPYSMNRIVFLNAYMSSQAHWA
jgi:hypothetical protein